MPIRGYFCRVSSRICLAIHAFCEGPAERENRLAWWVVWKLRGTGREHTPTAGAGAVGAGMGDGAHPRPLHLVSRPHLALAHLLQVPSLRDAARGWSRTPRVSDLSAMRRHELTDAGEISARAHLWNSPVPGKCCALVSL